MKKNIILSLVGILVLSLILNGCGKAPAETTSNNGEKDTAQLLQVGATPEPHAEILKVVQPILKEQGIELKIVEFTDYVLPNLALHDREIDANFFQHIPYMESFAKEHNIELEAVAKVHVEPLGLYSKKLTALEDLNDGAKIAIPNDPTNGGRALLLLEKHGLIRLAEGAGLEATKNDIVDNPKNLSFIELDAPQLPVSLDDVGAAIINTNYALEANLNPLKDALILEDEESPYANVLTVRPDSAKNEGIQKLIEALNSSEVRDFIEKNYKGAIVPVF